MEVGRIPTAMPALRVERTRRTVLRSEELPVSCSLCEERFEDVGACLEHHRLVHGDAVYHKPDRPPERDGQTGLPAGYAPPPDGSRFSFTA